jgi:hypothetical protein
MKSVRAVLFVFAGFTWGAAVPAAAAAWAWSVATVVDVSAARPAFLRAANGVCHWAAIVGGSPSYRLKAGRLVPGGATVDLDVADASSSFIDMAEDADGVVHLRTSGHALHWNGASWAPDLGAPVLSSSVAVLHGAIAADRVGGLHFAYSDGAAVVYASSLNGVWSSTSAIPLVEASQSVVDVAVSTAGVPYAALSTPYFYFGATTRTITVKRRVAGVWSTVVSAGPGINARLHMDGSGALHLLYLDSIGGGTIYRRYSNTGALQASTGTADGVFVEGPNGSARILQSGIDFSPSDGVQVAVPISSLSGAAYLADGGVYYLGVRSVPVSGGSQGTIAVAAQALRPDPPSATALGADVIRGEWTGFSAEALGGWRLRTDGGSSTDAPVGASSADLGGLSPNQSHAVTLEALYDGFALASSPTVVHTLARPPGGPTLSAAAGGVRIGWTANGNPGGTIYRVRAAGPEVEATPMETSDPSASLFLDAGRPHALTVSALNGDGRETFAGRFRAWRGDGAMLFDLPDGSTVSVVNRGAGSPTVLAWPVDSVADAPAGWTVVGPGAALRLAEPPSAGGGLTVEVTSSLIAGPADRLALARRDAMGRWDVLPGGSDGERVWGDAAREGDLYVVRREAASSGAVRATPNPFRPGDGRTLVLSDGVARFEVFTLTGRRVGDGVGDRWDGRTDDGGWVTRGVYVVVTEGAAGRRRLKVLVE